MADTTAEARELFARWMRNGFSADDIAAILADRDALAAKLEQMRGALARVRPSCLSCEKCCAPWNLSRIDALAQEPAAPAPMEPQEPNPVSDSPFDQAVHQYAKATWHHDMAGMRAGYVALRDLFAAQYAAALRAMNDGEG